MSTNTAVQRLNIDAIFESAQRAHAVILLLTDASSDPLYGDAITYSLWAVERELREIKEAIDAIPPDDPQGSPSASEMVGTA